MKLFTQIFTPLFIAALMLAAGCGGNPSEPNRLTGTLHGKVTLYDMRNRQTDHSGVKVSVDGTSYETITQADGRWSITSLPAGTYNLRFTKDGFGEDRIFNHRFVGGGEDYMEEAADLTVIPAGFRFTDFNVAVSNQAVRFHGGISNPDLKDLPVAVFLGLMSDVSAHPKDHFHSIQSRRFHAPLAHDTVIQGEFADISFENLRREGIGSGTTIHARAYVTSKFYTGYYDPSTTIITRTDLSKVSSDVISFVLP